MIPLAHADREAHHRHRYSPPASGKTCRRYRFSDSMLRHLMAHDRAELSVSQTLRPSSKTPCVLRRKPSLCEELRRLGTSSFHEHHRGISMIPLAHADREAHHRHRYSPAASGKTFRRYRLSGSMLCHLMAYDRTKLSVSQTLRPSSRTPCVLRRKPSPRKELRRLSTSAPMLFLRGPVPSCRGHCSTSEARCPGHRASEVEQWPRQEATVGSARVLAGCRPGSELMGTGLWRRAGCRPGVNPALGSRLRKTLGRRP